METLLLTKTKEGAAEAQALTAENDRDRGLSEPGRNNVEARPSRSADPEEEKPTEAELLHTVVVRMLTRL